MQSIGKYTVLNELGSGGFGAVYLAEDPHLGDKVAIKVFQIKDQALAREVTSATGDAGEILKQRFLDEAKILRRLSASPHVVSVHEFETLPDGRPYYVMPYLPNSLVDLIGRDAFTAGRLEEIDEKDHPRALPITQALDILKQTLEGLKTVHEAGLVHRDIKPANLLIETKGQLHNVVLCDFGIAKMPEGEHSKTGVGMGSPNYVSPEQRESAKHVDARSDVFSVGVLAYRMLTGSVPMVTGQQPVKQFIPGITDELNDLVMNAINFDPTKRPTNAADFLFQLQKAEAAFAGNIDDIEESGTWVGESASGLKDELKPLRAYIINLLNTHAEIPDEEKDQLDALAAVADLDQAGLQALIEESQQSLQAQLKPKQNLLKLIDSKVQDNTLDTEATRSAIYTAGESVGWSSEQLDTIIERKTGGSKSKGRKKCKTSSTQNKSNSNAHAQRTPGTTQEKPSIPSKLPKAIGALLVVGALIGGGVFYSDYQAQQQLLAEQAAIAKESEVKAWTQAQSNNTEQSYTLYLENWPQGEHAGQAQQAMSELKEQARLAQLSAEELEKERIAKIQDYLNRLDYQVPTHGNLDQRTIGNIKAFERDQGQPEIGAADDVLLQALKAEYSKRDTAAWNKAKKTLTPKAYQNYKSAFPQGAYVAQVENQSAKANAAIALAKDEAAWAKTKKTHTEKAYTRYQKDFPDGKYVEQAAVQIQKVKEDLEAARIAEAKAKAEAERKEKERLAKLKREQEAFLKRLNLDLVDIPQGSFQMGSRDGADSEKPVHQVTINAFEIMAKELTWAQYQPCIDAGVCSSASKDSGWGKGNRPVTNVSWEDTQTYIKWLNRQSGKRFRLPSEAEWEKAARARSTAKYSWGDSIDCSRARYGYLRDECGKQGKTDTSGSFVPNAFGLYDMHGNVSEWTQDCWHDSYRNAPTDGRAWLNENGGDCSYRVLRGGSWKNAPNYLRSASRGVTGSARRFNNIGFRIVQGG